MKTKLLKRFRRKANNKYKVYKSGREYIVYNKYTKSIVTFTYIENDAINSCNGYRIFYIQELLENYRIKHKKLIY